MEGPRANSTRQKSRPRESWGKGPEATQQAKRNSLDIIHQFIVSGSPGQKGGGAETLHSHLQLMFSRRPFLGFYCVLSIRLSADIKPGLKPRVMYHTNIETSHCVSGGHKMNRAEPQAAG